MRVRCAHCRYEWNTTTERLPAACAACNGRHIDGLDPVICASCGRTMIAKPGASEPFRCDRCELAAFRARLRALLDVNN